MVQCLPPPLPHPMMTELGRVLRRFTTHSLQEWSAPSQADHIPIAHSRFSRFADVSKDKTLSTQSIVCFFPNFLALKLLEKC